MRERERERERERGRCMKRNREIDRLTNREIEREKLY